MGDFNTDLLSENSLRSRKLLEIIRSSSLHVLPLQATHHIIDGHDTWLDLILSSSPSLVSASGQLPAPGFSHHDLIFLSYSLKPPKPRPRVLHLRSFGRMDVEKLHRDASHLKWDDLYSAPNIDTKVNIFCRLIKDLYDIHALVHKVKIKRLPAPWMTRGVRMMMRRRDRLFRRFRRERCENNWRLFKAARNKCNQVIRNAKRQHILNNLSSSSPVDVWKFLGSLGIGRMRNLDNQFTLGLDDINAHFSTTYPMDQQAMSRTLRQLSALTRPNIQAFSFSPVAEDDVKRIILSIKSNAVGADAISRRMITPILEFLLSPISHIINFSLWSGQVPEQWRMAYVIPLPKVPNPTLPSHFRPISILPFLSKVLEACVHKQLYLHISRHHLLNPLQSGFRPGHSTTSALLKVTHDIRAGMEDTKATVVVLVDFSNAFNTLYVQASVGDISRAIDLINEDLDHVRDWSERFGLVVNPSKCQSIIVGSQRTLRRLEELAVPPIVFNGSIISVSQTVKNLGLLMDSSLSWQAQDLFRFLAGGLASNS
ncbi:uncharacterized protein LOC113496727 [Trichoplusia ni]|uniref:Uncharacterized protein LOC113496727 n=1 Tax=Trichoplusia ni TaxID=7111 RepID=A0A7E5VU27_TRINI|nr:uncharacterized protein LOC113496727 [Trichoplusia ni]